MIKIINPKAELLTTRQNERVGIDYNFIANCARVCYKSTKEQNDEENRNFVLNKIKDGHLSLLRHNSRYFIIYFKYVDKILNLLFEKYSDNPFINIYPHFENFYISTNSQFIYEHEEFYRLAGGHEVSEKEFFEKAPKILHRFTFKLITQLSTSRELNRVSPNNITEQSTRYCNYSSNKFDNSITICKPHWLNYKDDYNNDEFTFEHGQFGICNTTNCKLISVFDIFDGDEKYIHKCIKYLKSCENHGEDYNELIKFFDFPAEDARGVLPLDTTTEVIYTYSLKEWIHIVDNRYFGVTGKPHPNAKLIIGKVYDIFRNLGYEEYFRVK